MYFKSIAFRFFLAFFLLFSFIGFGQELKLRIPKGGEYYISDFSFSPDGKYVLTSHLNNHDFLWEIESGKFVDGVQSISTTNLVNRKSEFNSSGTYFISILDRSEIALENVSTGEFRSIPFADSSFNNYADTYYSAKFSPDGKKIIATTSDSTFELWDVHSQKRLAKIKGHLDHVKQAEFSPNGQVIVSSSWDSTLIIWDATDPTNPKKTHSIRCQSGLFDFNISKNNLYLLAAFDDSTIKVFDLKNGNLINQLVLEENSQFELFNLHDNNVIIAVGNNLVLWNFLDGNARKLLKGHQEKIAHFTLHPTENTLASTGLDSIIIFWDLDSGNIKYKLSTKFSASLLSFSPITSKNKEGGQFLLCGSKQFAYLLDAVSGKIVSEFKSKTSSIWNTIPAIYNEEKVLCFYGYDSSVYQLNRITGKVKTLYSSSDYISLLSQVNGNSLFIVKQNGVYDLKKTDNSEIIIHGDFGHPVYFSRYNGVGGLIAATDFDNKLSLHRLDFKNKSISKFNVKEINQIVKFGFDKTGSQLLTGTTTGDITLWDVSGKTMKNKWSTHIKDTSDSWITYIEFLPDDQFAVIGTGNGAILLLNIQSKEIQKTLGYDYLNVEGFQFNKNGTKLLSCSGSTVSLWDFTKDTIILIHEFTYESDVYKAYFSENEDTIYAGSVDGSIRFWNAVSGKEIIRSYLLDADPYKWVHIHPSGLFDASPEAMELMYWTKGLEVIEFAQLKDRYWVPGLWEKVMKGEPLPDARNMKELKLQPEVELGELKDGKLPVTLSKREGGYGKVSILINGKEVQADARGDQFDKTKETQTIWIDLKDHPNLKDSLNVIAVKASSEDGFVVGRPVETKVMMNIQTSKPHFYAIVIGTGKFVNEKINLKYPEKDAQSMSMALQLGSEHLFGKENTHIYTLTTSSGDRPTKEKIKYTFSEIGKKATSSDVIVIYLSGHGIAWGGDQGDFYYVTTEATAANAEAFSDEFLRKNYTISSSEFTEYLKAIPANKQVMIIDACSSGKAVENLMAARDIDVSSIKAIDRMKDRTGMFVISGSAADAVSYEASRYGQGLLTYSILQAMKGAALRDGQFFDVNAILNYSRENVPKLAAGIGGIQTPQLLVPKGGSFDIGRVDEASKAQIPLSNIKPVFVRTTFVDAEAFTDDLNLSKLVDDKLNQIAMRGSDGQLVFLDTREFPDAYRLSGGYTQSSGNIALKLKIKGPKESEHTLNAKTKEELVEKVVEIVEELE